MDLLQHEPLIHALDLQYRPPVYDSMTILEGLDLAPLITGIHQFPIMILKGVDTEHFLSQKRSFKVSSKHALEFPLNSM